jgi:hypothetical protein
MIALHFRVHLAVAEEAWASSRIHKRAFRPCVPGLLFFKISKKADGPLCCRFLYLERNDRLSSSSEGRVRENFRINQQMSTFTLEIRIESAEFASMPRCRSSTSILPVDYIELFFLVLK